jgi:hypothetical protein
LALSSHYTPQGNYLAIKLNDKIKFQNFIKEGCNIDAHTRPKKDPDAIRASWISIFKRIIPHINIQIQIINRTR